MTINYDELGKIEDYLTILTKGVDPFTNIQVDDTILNNHSHQEQLKQIISIIRELKENALHISKIDQRKKINFFLNEEQKNAVSISEFPISISMFTYKINEVIDNNIMKKLRATQVTTWLMNNGYLNINDNSVNKITTKRGEELGINLETKVNEHGEKYTVCLYTKCAQCYIIDNINEIAKQS